MSIGLTSHFKNGVANMALTNGKKKKPQVIHIAGGNCSYLQRKVNVLR